MNEHLAASQCRHLIAELAGMLPPLFRMQAERRIRAFGDNVEEPDRRTRWDPVFAGGGIVQLLITDPAAQTASHTKDVDIVIEIASYGEYVEIEEALRLAGFKKDSREDAPIVAWYWNGSRIDILPHKGNGLIPRINRWFPALLTDPVRLELFNGQFAWIASAPSFLATKFEAFFSRGGGDYMVSKDIEDILAVVDGRSELDAELADTNREIAVFLRKCFSDWCSNRRFLDCLPYLIPDSGREDLLIHRLKRLCDHRET
jgi:hypothetical protein